MLSPGQHDRPLRTASLFVQRQRLEDDGSKLMAAASEGLVSASDLKKARKQEKKEKEKEDDSISSSSKSPRACGSAELRALRAILERTAAATELERIRAQSEETQLRMRLEHEALLEEQREKRKLERDRLHLDFMLNLVRMLRTNNNS